jgi:hypothetical protein
MKKLLLLTLLLTIATHHLQSQVVQELNTRSAVKTWVVKDALSIPQVATLPASPALLNYHPSASKGSPVWCTCLTDTSRIGFNVWDGAAWQTLKPIGATLPPVPAGSFLDSTGQYQGRPLISAPGQRISSSPFFLYDTANRKLVINNTNVSIGGPQYKLYVNGKTYSAGLTLGNMTNYIGAPQDDTRYPLAWDINGDVVTFMQWPKVRAFENNVTGDSIILLFSNGDRFAVPRPAGGGGVTTVGSFSSVGNANGLSISGTDIIGHPATATEPGMVSIGAQSYLGPKTFIDPIHSNNTTGASVNSATPALYMRNDGGTRQGIGKVGSDFHFFNPTAGIYRWYGGGDLSSTPSDWLTLSSTAMTLGTGVGLSLNSVLRTAGAASNTAQASIYLRDFTGAGNRVGIGRGIADMHFFSIATYGFRWYGGGDFNTGASNWMFLDEQGLALFGANATPSIFTANSTTKGTIPAPRMTATQRNAISSPTAGLQVFNTTDNTVDVRDGTRWNNTPNGLKASATLNFGSTAAQSSADLTITVTGAADGDIVIVGTVNGSTNANSCYTAWVSAADTVTVRFNNYSSTAIDPASGTFRVYVIKN